MPTLRQFFLPRPRGAGAGPLGRRVAEWVFGRSALRDPLDGHFVPYYGLGRRRLRLLLDATNKCNLRCVMCHFALPEAQRAPAVQWSVDDLGELERDVLPYVKHATLSAGSEPLMWKGFPALLEVMRRARVPGVEMITNGLLLTDELCDAIVSAGMTRLQLSLDGATRKTYESVRIGGSFEQFLSALERINAAKRRARSALPALQLNYTLMRRNVGELEELVRLAHEQGVEYLDLRHVVTNDALDIGDETLLLDKRRSNRELARARAQAAEVGIELVRCPEDFDTSGEPEEPAPALVRSDSAKVRPNEVGDSAFSEASDPPSPQRTRPAPYAASAAQAERSRGYPHLDLDGLPEKPICDAPWRQFNIKPDRTVAPCCFWYTEEPLGDLERESFQQIWQGEGYRRLRWEILSGRLGPNCARCPVNGIGSVNDERAFRALRPTPREAPLR